MFIQQSFHMGKTSVSCCSALSFNKCLEIHLQNRSVHCICSNASNLSTVRGLGVRVATGEIFGETSGCGVEVVSGESFLVCLLVFEAGPSLCV